MGQLNEISELSLTLLPGAELWAVPFSPSSQWFKKLNWYCASQLSRWIYRPTPHYADSLKQIIQSEQLPFTDQKQYPNDFILVHTEKIFPNKALMAINVEPGAQSGLEKWLTDLQKKATQLELNTLRIFWGQKQIDDLLTGLKQTQSLFKDFNLEIVTCEPDPL